MPCTLTKAEKETTLIYNQTAEPVHIATYDSSIIRRLASFAQRYPDFCKRTDNGLYPKYAEYEIVKGRISIRLVPPRTEEQRKAASEMAKQHGLGTMKKT